MFARDHSSQCAGLSLVLMDVLLKRYFDGETKLTDFNLRAKLLHISQI